MNVQCAFIAELCILLGMTTVAGELRAAPVDLAGTVAASDDDDPSPLMQQAFGAFRRGDERETLKWLRQARVEDPKLPPPEVMLANMYYSNDQPAEGRKTLERAAIQHPTDPEPHLIFGDLAWRERRLSDAQLQYERGGNLTASFAGPPERKRTLKVRALIGLANVAEARGQFKSAQEWLERLLSVDPDHANAHFRLGNVLFQSGQVEEAVSAFRTAKQLDDSAPTPSLTVAQLYRQSGKIDEAEKWIEQAVADSPDDPHCQLMMARWQLEQHHALDAAARHVEIAAQLAPTSPEVPLLRGLISWARGDLRDAEKAFETLYLKEPEHPAALNGLAAVLAEQDDAERKARARELIQLASSKFPSDPDTIATAGWVAFQMGELDRANTHLLAGVAAPGVSRDTTYYFARTQFRRGQIAAALDALERAMTTTGLFVHRDQAHRWQRELNVSSDD